jgi:hypothetical protein
MGSCCGAHKLSKGYRNQAIRSRTVMQYNSAYERLEVNNQVEDISEQEPNQDSKETSIAAIVFKTDDDRLTYLQKFVIKREK